MQKFLTVLPLCAAALLASAASGLAQTATTQTDATQTDTTTEAPAPAQTPETGAAAEVESQLSLGEDADKASDLGQPYTKEVIGAWDMRCIRTEQETDPCQMYQLLDDGQGTPVAEFSLFRLPGDGKAKAGATIVVPLETALPNQLTIRVDGGSARRYPFAFCNPVGCYVRLGLTEADVSAFKRGAEAKISIVPALAPDQTVELTLSLSGFTASYDKVSVIEQ
ncbi:invasion associated locus B family protein [Sulfitobacter sabulilitoris]|uniref:Invasion associated locus B family protein n=1 Tax=Sulfitobacter sabulilitoris TaxID=2562655 RepID=A0A5S3PJL5_9RHOB|nr:invasion associated locus B family protein [Sulfitobacter sabulilitoris]TMM54604.1 invasion associated locus B family protein [Sulfitobacter sabulilitoris]